LDLFAYRLLERGSVSLQDLRRIDTDVSAEVAAAMERAAAAPDAGADELGLEDVFADRDTSLARARSRRASAATGAGLGSGDGPGAASASRRLTQTEAAIEAIASEMRRDRTVFYIGQDVGAMGGSLQGTRGLLDEFGPARVR